MYIYHENINQIESERLILRFYKESDAEKVAYHCNNINLNKGVAGLPFPYTKDHALNWFERQKSENYPFFDFAIVIKETNELVGSISLFDRINQRIGEIGYWIGEDHWHKGYATEACQAIIHFAFETLHYHKVYARHFKSNPYSGKVMINCGMTKEGEQIDHFYKNDHYETLVLYGLINNR